MAANEKALPHLDTASGAAETIYGPAAILKTDSTPSDFEGELRVELGFARAAGSCVCWYYVVSVIKGTLIAS